MADNINNYLSVIYNLNSNFNPELVKSVSFYLRSFLMARYENQLDIYINYNGIVCKRIYSTFQPLNENNDTAADDDDFGFKIFLNEQNDKIDNITNNEQMNPLNLACALSIILCQNNTRKLTQSSSKSSILVVNENTSILPSSQYVQFMNTVFEAQRNGIKINVLDVVDLEVKLKDKDIIDNVLLKQAASITSGYFIVIRSISEIIPILLNFSDISKNSLTFLNRPKQEIVDFRGSCFCHGNVVDFGYVCSVCLSSNYG